MPATTALTYNGLVAQVALLAPYQTQLVNGVLQGIVPITPANPGDFTTLISQMLNYAEQRIQRDLDLQALRGGAANVYHLTPGNANLAIPAADFVVIEALGAFNPSGGFYPLNPVSRDYLLATLAQAPLGPPKVFAMIGGFAAGLVGTIVAFGPTPDQAYAVYAYGTTRAPSLATYATPSQAGVGTTWLSTWLPDLLVMACMIYVSAYQRDFGRQSDDPQMALSYEAQYGTLLASVDKEEYRKRFEADAWTSRASSPIATPTRT
jgi:hypothetical protein